MDCKLQVGNIELSVYGEGRDIKLRSGFSDIFLDNESLEDLERCIHFMRCYMSNEKIRKFQKETEKLDITMKCDEPEGNKFEEIEIIF